MGEGRALLAARESGLVRAGEPLLVLLSGGADSVCLLDVARELGARVSALHVNHGLREEADEDEAFCAALCERLGVPLFVERARPSGRGNVQAEARELRYALAERHRGEGDYAAAHTASDQAETVLYRLAVSPGRRALLGMPARRGHLVRPLLYATREETRAWCTMRGLEWREDRSNRDTRYARVRVREEILPALRTLNPAAERNLADTADLLRDEAEVLEAAVADALARLGSEWGAELAELRALPRGLARLVLRRLAERAARRELPLSRRDADALLELGSRGGTQELDIGGGVRAVAEYGTLRFTRRAGAAGGPEPPPEPAVLAVPGSVRFGDWEVVAELGPSGEALLDAGSLGQSVTVRSWRPGDRMRPAGLGGTKTLQDLFTDRKVPRGLRATLPVVEAGGEIAWVAGVAVGERFRAAPGAAAVVSLSARPRSS
ncbi:MAG: tRNA lysidine(34) synthetase TilS [Thermoleophilaceae bacterium]|nr:tRNA lysidine(34) synthetase TilS [Thermoleophilaceae bacterium]